jgi:flagellar export protein FliJ
MPAQRYRLQALLVIKEREKDRAAALLAKAIVALQEARKKEKELIEEKEKIIKKWRAARAEMRREMDRGAAVGEGNVHVNYLRKLKEDEEKKQKEIDEQHEVVLEAEEAVVSARKDYIEAAKEHQVMVKHKELWQKKLKEELSKKEEREFDELGNTIHQLRKWKGEKSVFTL